MIIKHPSITYDLVAVSNQERLDKSLRAAMIAEAIRAGGPRVGLFRSIRQAFGGALIGVGQMIHGERSESADHAALPAANTLGLAR